MRLGGAFRAERDVVSALTFNWSRIPVRTHSAVGGGCARLATPAGSIHLACMCRSSFAGRTNLWPGLFYLASCDGNALGAGKGVSSNGECQWFQIFFQGEIMCPYSVSEHASACTQLSARKGSHDVEKTRHELKGMCLVLVISGHLHDPPASIRHL